MEHVDASSFRAWIDELGLSATEREIRSATAVAAIADTATLLLKCPLELEGDVKAPWAEDAPSTAPSVWKRAPSRFSTLPPWEKYVNKACPHVP